MYRMTVSVDTVPYSIAVLHSLKYPSKGVSGLLIGTRNGNNVQVTGAVPLSHETSPLSPSLEIGLSLVHARHPKIVGVYFSNQNYQDKSLNPVAARLAERVSAVCGGPPLLVQLVNYQLSLDCPTNCFSAHIKDGDSWKDAKLEPSSSSLSALSSAIQQKLYREISDFDNHLDRPEADFFNTQLSLVLGKIH